MVSELRSVPLHGQHIAESETGNFLIIPSQTGGIGYLPSGVRTPIHASRTC